MMTCAEFRRLESRFLSLELSEREETAVRLHAEGCRSCAGHLGQREPSFLLSIPLAFAGADEDERFASDVMAGIHQRRLEARVRTIWPRRAAVAAGVVLAFAAGVLSIQEGRRGTAVAAGATHLSQPATAAHAVLGSAGAVVAGSPVSGAPAMVEVEGRGVRLYQLGTDGVQVAFIVDPSLEL